jgi:glycosyltransferase involved in cell wall biosynthesis
MPPQISDYRSYWPDECDAQWEPVFGPLLSIVTIVWNDAPGLRNTIQSVREQKSDTIEYIVVDGDSTDETRDVIAQNDDVIDQWISEPDRGISDGFNKGIAMACGAWINLLNAGDTLADTGGLSHIMKVLRHTNARIVTSFASSGHTRLPKHRIHNDMSLARRARISHQGSFVHRRVYGEYGLYRTDLRYRMDLDFWLRTLREERMKFLDTVYCVYEGEGVSAVNHVPMILEGHHVEADHLSAGEQVPAMLRSLASNAIRVPYHWIRRKLS